ncbi:MAG: hypothetical protein IT272_07725 [Chitinophagales bacterium]|jgi:hypothetical protein|nr:hypothetical protein [Chitinophagales bacterium]
MHTAPDSWNQTDFLAFLLVYAGHTDFEFSAREQQFVIEQTNEEACIKALNLYRLQSDYDHIETIALNINRFYTTQSSREQLFTQIKQLFESDADFSTIEKNTWRILHHILDDE